MPTCSSGDARQMAREVQQRQHLYWVSTNNTLPLRDCDPESQMAPMGLNVTQPGQWACYSAPRPPAVAAGTHRPTTAHVGHAQTRDVYADPRCSHIRASHRGAGRTCCGP